MTEPTFHQPLDIPDAKDLDHEPRREEYPSDLSYNLAALAWSWKIEDEEWERREAKARRTSETVFAVVYGVIALMWWGIGYLALDNAWGLAVLEWVVASFFTVLAVLSWRRRG